MSALGLASLGVQCQNKALGMASLGAQCVVAIVVDIPRTGSGMRYARSQVFKDPKEITLDRLLRDDEEIVLMVISVAAAENE